jgi:hypothetical protein
MVSMLEEMHLRRNACLDQRGVEGDAVLHRHDAVVGGREEKRGRALNRTAFPFTHPRRDDASEHWIRDAPYKLQA